MLAAERTPGICQEPRPFVLQPALADFYVEYQLIVYIERIEERVFVLSDLHAHIQDLFNEFGVQIMSPHFVSQPEGAIVVPKSKWHTPPATEKEGAG
jgi:small-conductance mechanosensitive channel